MMANGFGRGTAVFVGGLSLINVVGELRWPNFDANHWWIDLRPLPQVPAALLLATAALLMLMHAVRPATGRRRYATAAVLGLLVLVTAANGLRFYHLAWSGAIAAGVWLPFSFLAAGAVGIVLVSVLRGRRQAASGVSGRSRVRCAAGFALALAVGAIGLPLAQMFLFGKTDYRRPADAIVVFGARAYADGRPSDALADRVRTACRLYHDGLAPRLIFSGGPGDGDIHETESMRRLALSLGVPDEAILVDVDGWNTSLTVANTARMRDVEGLQTLLAVSHYYHLPRVKMTYQRQGIEVYTVPAEERYMLRKLPLLMAREVAAVWVYYLRPILPERGSVSPGEEGAGAKALSRCSGSALGKGTLSEPAGFPHE